MRDRRFIAEHRGGALTKANHQLLIRWGRICTAHVLPLLSQPQPALEEVLLTALKWEQDSVSVGIARQASLAAIGIAREAADPVLIAVARSAGHAVATAHMADHAVKAAGYALKAASLAGRSVTEERAWQDSQLPDAIRELVVSARTP